jgi:hypothetical protein
MLQTVVTVTNANITAATPHTALLSYHINAPEIQLTDANWHSHAHTSSQNEVKFSSIFHLLTCRHKRGLQILPRSTFTDHLVNQFQFSQF